MAVSFILWYSYLSTYVSFKICCGLLHWHFPMYTILEIYSRLYKPTLLFILFIPLLVSVFVHQSDYGFPQENYLH